MHTALAPTRLPPRRAPPMLEDDAPDASDALSSQDRAFIALQDAYRPHGGILRMRRWAAGARVRAEGHDAELERLVEVGELFGFAWHDSLWLPLFQLNASGQAVAAGPEALVAEWGGRIDGWALACWFVLPHPGLSGKRPIECLDSRLPEVLQAARLDRFVITG